MQDLASAVLSHLHDGELPVEGNVRSSAEGDSPHVDHMLLRVVRSSSSLYTVQRKAWITHDDSQALPSLPPGGVPWERVASFTDAFAALSLLGTQHPHVHVRGEWVATLRDLPSAVAVLRSHAT